MDLNVDRLYMPSTSAAVVPSTNAFNLNTTAVNERQNPTGNYSIGINTFCLKRNQMFDDLRNPIFKLPFEHGWSREVYHKYRYPTLRSIKIYYHHKSFTNLRYSSLNEIKIFLILSKIDNTLLTTDNFSFKQEAIGISDTSKEFYTHVSRQHSLYDNNYPNFIGLRSNENSPKMRILSIANYLESLMYKRRNMEPELLGLDNLHDNESNSTLKRDVVLVPNNKKRKFSIVLQSSMITMKALRKVFSYLNVKDIFAVSRVCNAWNVIAMHSLSWKSVCLKDCRVYDWNSCITMLNFKHTNTLNADHMILPKNNEQLKEFWLNFAREIQRATHLKVLKIREPPTFVMNKIFGSLFQLEVLHINDIMFDYKLNDELASNIDKLHNIKYLKESKLKGSQSFYPNIIPTFSKLTNLKLLVLTSIIQFPENTVFSLNTLSTGLESLEIGNCDNLPLNFGSVIKRLVNLKSLRLVNCVSKCCYLSKSKSHDVFTSIGNNPKLKVLELVNVTLCLCVENSMKQWGGLKALMISSAHNNTSLYTKQIMKNVGKLFNTLNHFIYCIKIIHLPVLQELMKKSLVLEPSFPNYTNHFVTVICSSEAEETKSFDNIFGKANSVKILTTMLRNIFGTTYTIVVKASFDKTSSIYITDHFDDII